MIEFLILIEEPGTGKIGKKRDQSLVRRKTFDLFPYLTYDAPSVFSLEDDDDRELMDVTYDTVMRFAFRSSRRGLFSPIFD